jgi:glycosyltransferase involved in cell wall biosynthesis
VSRILLICDILPTSSHTAGIVLKQFLSHFPAQNEIHTYNVHSDGIVSYTVSERVTGSMRWTRKPQEEWKAPNFLKVFLEGISSREAIKIADDILKEISRQKPDHIIIVIQGQTMIRIANELRKHEIEFSTIHWDPFSWWMYHNKIPKRLESIHNELVQNLSRMKVHLVPSTNYANYLKLPENNFQVIGLAQENFLNSNDHADGVYRFVFSGQMYAKKELLFFIEYLDQIDWKIQDLKLELHIYGSNLNSKHENVFWHGWVVPEKLQRELVRYDCAVLPYPSDEPLKETAANSFPSKLVTYIGADLPVLYLGSTTHPFNKDLLSNISLAIINDPASLQGAIQRCMSLGGTYSKIREQLFTKYFSSEAQKIAVHKYLERSGLDSSGDCLIIPESVHVGSRGGNQFRQKALSLDLGASLYKLRQLPYGVIMIMRNTVGKILTLLAMRSRIIGGIAGLIFVSLSNCTSRMKSILSRRS